MGRSAGEGSGGAADLETPAEGKERELGAVEEEVEAETARDEELPAQPGEGHGTSPGRLGGPYLCASYLVQ